MGVDIMKKRLLMILAVAVLLVGCGSTDNKNTEAGTQRMETESSATSETMKEVESETTEVENATTTEVNTEVESEAPQPSEPEAPNYTYTDMDKTMYAKSSVNVRDLPSTDGEKLGSLSKAQEVHVTGQCNETGWYRIDYNGGVAHVSNSYLVNDKPVEETPTAPSQTEDTQNEVCPYELYVIYYDNQGYPYFYGKSGGSANMDADNWAKTDDCIKQIDNYMMNNFKVIAGDGSWSQSSITSWQYIGTYQGMVVVVRYIQTCNDVLLDSPESRGISTAGNGIW